MNVRYNLSGHLEVVLGEDVVYITRPTTNLRLFSPNQKKAIIAETEKLIETYDVGDCPTQLRLLLAQLKEAN